jgi:hypothetical protein
VTRCCRINQQIYLLDFNESYTSTHSNRFIGLIEEIKTVKTVQAYPVFILFNQWINPLVNDTLPLHYLIDLSTGFLIIKITFKNITDLSVYNWLILFQECLVLFSKVLFSMMFLLICYIRNNFINI